MTRDSFVRSRSLGGRSELSPDRCSLRESKAGRLTSPGCWRAVIASRGGFRGARWARSWRRGVGVPGEVVLALTPSGGGPQSTSVTTLGGRRGSRNRGDRRGDRVHLLA